MRLNNFLFLTSHYCSGSAELRETMNLHSQISISETETIYDNLLSLNVTEKHKLDNITAIWGDHILNNVQFRCKDFYSHCKFIFVIRSPKHCLNEMRNIFPSDQHAFVYYIFRLRRLYEMIVKTKQRIVLTWDDLQNKKSADLITEFLQLRSPLNFNDLNLAYSLTNDVAYDLIKKAEERYEYYLFKIKSIQ